MISPQSQASRTAQARQTNQPGAAGLGMKPTRSTRKSEVFCLLGGMVSLKVRWRLFLDGFGLVGSGLVFKWESSWWIL